MLKKSLFLLSCECESFRIIGNTLYIYLEGTAPLKCASSPEGSFLTSYCTSHKTAALKTALIKMQTRKKKEHQLGN